MRNEFEHRYKKKPKTGTASYWLYRGRFLRLDIVEGKVIGVWVGRAYYLPFVISTLTHPAPVSVQYPVDRFIDLYRAGLLALM